MFIKLFNLILLVTLMLTADSLVIDDTFIDTTPLSNSYSDYSGYHTVIESDKSNSLIFEKENSYFWWAMMVLFLGLSLSLKFIGFAKVDTTRDNKILSPSISTIFHEIKSQKLLTPEPMRIEALMITVIGIVILFKFINSWNNHERLIFDDKNKYFYHQDISASGEVEILKSIPFDEIRTIQYLTYDERGEKFYNFELNLVLENSERIHLFAMQNQDEMLLKSLLVSNALQKDMMKQVYKD
ncbi:hypothetical protein [Sulfurovum mangrovi]|uniref:hypothetical protein n=1 Tax=Sulfurovum mangrovi TaxID=2893889 RepID=UPI001E3E1B14|nr:hypothetical protein [Sulfurovum mangrovi]UFH59661.1 hypothetical protein LN246_02130 [Sulfurovum mangrovi]UFH60807.1 hypothetical protein LN246_14745 [Sulfurovum mangrovi]